MNDILLGVFLGPAGVALVLALIGKFMPEGPRRKAIRALGRFISNRARSKVGKAFWEPIEDELKKVLKETADDLGDGMDEDDKNGDEKKGRTP